MRMLCLTGRGGFIVAKMPPMNPGGVGSATTPSLLPPLLPPPPPSEPLLGTEALPVLLEGRPTGSQGTRALSSAERLQRQSDRIAAQEKMLMELKLGDSAGTHTAGTQRPPAPPVTPPPPRAQRPAAPPPTPRAWGAAREGASRGASVVPTSDSRHHTKRTRMIVGRCD